MNHDLYDQMTFYLIHCVPLAADELAYLCKVEVSVAQEILDLLLAEHLVVQTGTNSDNMSEYTFVERRALALI